MPRPERPLSPEAGPVQRFAAELRELRRRAGNPSYREMAQQAGFSVTTLSDAAGGRRLPGMPVVSAYVRACDGDVEAWYERWQRVAATVAAQRPGISPADRAPYVGLVAFGVDDADRFFGRQHLVEELLSRIAGLRLLAVFGPSGSGKSSLLRAGLIASMRRADPTARVVLMTPGTDPCAALARTGVPTVAGRLLLVVDQFEEVFTLCRDPDERDRFVSGLLALTHDEAGTRVVLGVRADFYARCADHPALVAALAQHTMLVGPMSDDEVRQAICEPAALVGLSVERALVTQVLADARGQPGALPLVSHALRETWRCRQASTLTLAAYHATGGVHGAIAQTAERVYGRLTPAQQRTTRHLLLRLTALGEGTADTRCRVHRRELDLPGVDEVISEWVNARLLVVDDDAVDIAHEALISAWPRLREWLSDDRDALRTHRQLSEAATVWQALGRDPDALYRGVRLMLACEWRDVAGDDALTGAERRFLTASMEAEAAETAARARRARQRRFLTGALAVLLVVAITATAIAGWQWNNAVEQRQQALSRQLAAQALAAADTDVPAAMQLSLDGYRAAPTVEARSALLSIAGRRAYSGRLQHGGMVKDVAFSPDGSSLATAGQDGSIVVWDRVQRARRMVLTGHDSPVRTVTYGPDGRWLVSTARNGTVLIWDLVRGRVRTELDGHRGLVNSVAISPNGDTIASIGVQDRILLWHARDGTAAGELRSPGGEESHVVFSPDGRLLASAGGDGTAVLWDVATMTRSKVLRAGTEPLFAAAFSPDGRRLATAGYTGDITIWDVRTGTSRGLLRGRGDVVSCLAFTPDGTELIAGDYEGRMTVWDPARKAIRVDLDGHAGEIYGVAISPDGQTVAGAGRDRSVLLWDRASMPMAGHSGEVNAVAVAGDGRSLLSVGLDGTVTLWDLSTHSSRTTLGGLDRAIDAAFGPDGRTVAVAARDGTVRLWYPFGGAETRTLRGHTDRVNTVAFGSDGTLLATGGADRIVRIWNIATGTSVVAARHPAQVQQVMFAPDGHTLISASQDGTVMLWDVARNTAVAQLHEDGGLVSAHLDREGHLLALGRQDGITTLWRLPDRTRAGHLDGHVGPVHSITTSPDGRLLATAGLDGTIRLRRSSDRQLLATLTGTKKGVGDLKFSTDSRLLYAGTGDHTVIAWPVDSADAVRRTCANLSRDFARRSASCAE